MEAEKSLQHHTGSVRNLFRCDDGSNLLDRSLPKIVDMKKIIEEIYGKGSFFEVAGKNIVNLFEIKEEATKCEGKK